MIKKVAFFFLLTMLLSCKSESKKEVVEKEPTKNTSITRVNYKELEPYLTKNDDKTYIVNFWATWCAPCVKELPYFEKINKEYASQNVEVLLVSLDFPNQVKSRLVPFLEKRNLQSDVVLLDDSNEDYWIRQIDESWSGAIPATIIYNKNNRKFYEQSFDYETLENELKQFLN